MILTSKTPPYISGVIDLQARQDLNPQPLVLETSALPIELLAYVSWVAIFVYNYPTFKLLGFAMRRVFPATRTKFAKLKTVRVVSAVLLSSVISLFAVVALKRNHGSNVFLL